MRTTITRLAVIAGLALAPAALADVPWGNGMSSGSGSFFDWANGHNSNTNLFGTPILVGSSFYFFPSDFVARSDNGSAPLGFTDHATDTLEVDLIAHAGLKIDGISVTESGDYSISGSNASANITGVLQVSDAAHGSLVPDNLGYNPVFPAYSGFNTPWSGNVNKDLTTLEFGIPFEVIHLSIRNDLIAVSAGGSTSVIRKTVVGGAMAINVLPEPGVLGLVAMAGLVGARRRRS